MIRVLLVEDDPSIVSGLGAFLRGEDCAVTSAGSQREALDVFGAGKFDIALVDLSLPDGSGFAVCAAIKQQSDTPVIFVTASGDEYSVVAGLDMGADDYIAKPFSLHEVLARVKAVLRRHERKATPNETTMELAQTIHSGGILADLLRKVVLVNGEEVRLSPKELGILCLLLRHPGRVFSREEILAQVWRGESYVLDRTVDVHIARIRRKLGNEGMRLTNRQGYGYCLEA